MMKKAKSLDELDGKEEIAKLKNENCAKEHGVDGNYVDSMMAEAI